MASVPPAVPIRFDPSHEVIADDEEQTARELRETMLGIARKTYEDGGHAIRSVHAKSHAILKAELTVPEGLPPVLAQGLFARAGRYDAVLRLSTIPGDILPDSVSTPRGVALKIIGVEGERAPGSKEAAVQDFILVNGKTFSAPNAKAFLGNLKMLAATTDRVEGLKKVLSAALRGVETVVEGVTGKGSAMVKALGGQRYTHPLGDSYYSQAPILYGDHIAKVGLVPASPELTALTDAKIDLDGRPDGLREEMNAFFRGNGGAWDLQVQLCTDLDAMPVEDPTVEWDEKKSPYLTVARLTVQPQPAWNEGRSTQVDDGMGFSPWHALAAHRPLGQIMRVRRISYDASQRFRSERNRCPVHEPRSASEVG